MTNNTETALAETVCGKPGFAQRGGQSRLYLSGQNVCQVCEASLTAVYRKTGFGDTCAVLEQEWGVYLVAAKGERIRRWGVVLLYRLRTDWGWIL